MYTKPTAQLCRDCVVEFKRVHGTKTAFFARRTRYNKIVDFWPPRTIFVQLNTMAAAAGGRDDARGESDDVELMSKQVTAESKRIYLNLRQNPRGRYLKVRMLDPSHNALLAASIFQLFPAL